MEILLFLILMVLLFGREAVLSGFSTIAVICIGILVLVVGLVAVGAVFATIDAMWKRFVVLTVRGFTAVLNSPPVRFTFRTVDRVVGHPVVRRLRSIVSLSAPPIMFLLCGAALPTTVLFVNPGRLEPAITYPEGILFGLGAGVFTLILLSMLAARARGLRFLPVLIGRRRPLNDRSPSLVRSILVGFFLSLALLIPYLTARTNRLERGQFLDCDILGFSQREIVPKDSKRISLVRMVEKGLFWDVDLASGVVPNDRLHYIDASCAEIRRGKPALVLKVFSGGAHCCTSLYWISKDGETVKAWNIDSWDGDLAADTIGVFDADRNGDGVILYSPTFFLSHFSAPPNVDLSFAASPVLPRYLCFQSNGFVDCTVKFDILVRRLNELAPTLKPPSARALRIVAEEKKRNPPPSDQQIDEFVNDFQKRFAEGQTNSLAAAPPANEAVQESPEARARLEAEEKAIQEATWELEASYAGLTEFVALNELLNRHDYFERLAAIGFDEGDVEAIRNEVKDRLSGPQHPAEKPIDLKEISDALDLNF